jgi:hypothetical protein
MAAEMAGALCGGAARDLGTHRPRGEHDIVRAARPKFVVPQSRGTARSRTRLESCAARRRQDCTLVRGTRLRRCALLFGRREWTRMARAWRRRRLGCIMGRLPWRRLPPVLSRARSADRGPVHVAEHAHEFVARTAWCERRRTSTEHRPRVMHCPNQIAIGRTYFFFEAAMHRRMRATISTSSPPDISVACHERRNSREA